MRGVLAALPLFAVPAVLCCLHARRAASAPSPAATSLGITDVQLALIGSWAGILECRYFSEPTTSTKRVKLPTWLDIEPAGADLPFRYIYDDGPAKTVTGT